MQCKTIVLWWLVNETEHPALAEADKKIDAIIPLVAALFPGINYYSITGFDQVMRRCVIPALKKRFPDLLKVPAASVGARATREVEAVLPSKGYEWQDSKAWKKKFEKLMAA